MNVGWIWTANLRPFFEILGQEVGYDIEASDWTAIELGLNGTDSESGPWFDYPLASATVFVALEPGADEMVSVRLEGITEAISARMEWLADLARGYRLERT